MISAILDKHNFEFFDDINELPIKQFHLYSKYVMLESNLGSDIQAFDAHLARAMQFLGRDDKKCQQELLNLRQNYYFILNGTDLINKATMCLVSKVDGKKWEDFSESGIDRLYSLAFNEKVRTFVELKGKLHKRIDEELVKYFPDIFESSVRKNYTDLLRKRALLQLSYIIEGADHTEEINALTNDILRYYEPKNFEGKESEEIKFDKQFEEMCLIIAREYGGNVKDYSVMEFYSAYTRMDKENKEMRKRLKKK